jgi:hypothetical protein
MQMLNMLDFSYQFSCLKITSVTQSKKSFSPEKPEKPGLLKRLLCWIAKGADKSNMGKASCPT